MPGSSGQRCGIASDSTEDRDRMENRLATSSMWKQRYVLITKTCVIKLKKKVELTIPPYLCDTKLKEMSKPSRLFGNDYLRVACVHCKTQCFKSWPVLPGRVRSRDVVSVGTR